MSGVGKNINTNLHEKRKGEICQNLETRNHSMETERKREGVRKRAELWWWGRLKPVNVNISVQQCLNCEKTPAIG